VRWTDRPIRSDAFHLPTNDVMPIPHLSWNNGMRNKIKSMASILRQSLNWGLHFVRSLAAGELTLGVARKYFINLWSEIFAFLKEFRKWLHNFFIRRTTGCVHAFTVLAHTTMADFSTLDPLLSFNTDSSFWVCDNSATGHICNNKELFKDELVPSIYEVDSATGISAPTLMCIATLRITDGEGAKHSFILKNVHYLPNSPVNILSLRRLVELYPDDAGHPDRTGTGIRP